MKKYVWLLPALYVAYMFGNKLFEGLGHSEEFQAIIGVIPFLKSYAYSLTPLVGIWDAIVAVMILATPLISRDVVRVRSVFVWATLWPLLPASLRYFGGVGDFEIAEVGSIMLVSLLAWSLWEMYSKEVSVGK